MKIKILILTLVLSLAVAGLALADNGLEWPRWVLGGGATDAAAGDVTLGQGFWHGGELPEGGHDIYLPLLAK